MWISRQKNIRYEVWYFKCVHPQSKHGHFVVDALSLAWFMLCYTQFKFGLSLFFPSPRVTVQRGDKMINRGRRLLNCSPETNPQPHPQHISESAPYTSFSLALFLSCYFAVWLTCSADFLCLWSGSTNMLLWHFTKSVLHCTSATPH